MKPAPGATFWGGWSVGLATLAAAILRLYHLGGQSLWIDEILSIQVARRIQELGWASHLFHKHGPLYFHLLSPFAGLEPIEFWARFPSALFGVAAVPAVAALGRNLVDARTGPWAAWLMAISPFGLWYSQETRYVNLLILVSILATWLLHRAVRLGRGVDIAAWGLGMAATALTFVGGIFLIGAHAVWVALVRPPRGRLIRLAIAAGIVLLVFVPWLIMAFGFGQAGQPGVDSLSRSVAGIKAGHGRAGHPLQAGYALYSFAVGFSWGPSVRALHQDLGLGPVARSAIQVVPAILMFGIAGLIGVRHAWRTARQGLLLILLVLAAAILGALATSWLTKVAFNVRYAAAGFPPTLLLLAAGLAGATGRGRRGWILAAPVLAILVGSVYNAQAREEYARDDFRGAARTLAGLDDAGDLVLVGADQRAFRFYYSGRTEKWNAFALVEDGTEVIPATASGRVWVVAARPWEAEGFGTFLDRMEACFAQESRHEFPGVRLTLFRTTAGPDGGRPVCRLESR